MARNRRWKDRYYRAAHGPGEMERPAVAAAHHAGSFEHCGEIFEIELARQVHDRFAHAGRQTRRFTRAARDHDVVARREQSLYRALHRSIFHVRARTEAPGCTTT